MKKPFPVSLELFVGGFGAEPRRFRDAVILGEKLGFETIWLGDHYVPWAHRAGNAAHLWSMMGTCLEATKKVRVGPLVNAAIGGRYHPATVAHAIGTLDNMHPGRVVLAVGSGEAENEVPFFGRWPRWQERIDRLCEGIQLMRKLWTSDSYFDFKGKYFGVKDAFLYTKPRSQIEVVFSAYGPGAAFRAGEYGDALVTEFARVPFEKMEEKIFPAFDSGARRSGKDPRAMDKRVYVEFTLEDRRSYLKRARPGAGLYAKGALDEPDPRKLDEMAWTLSDDDLMKTTNFCSSWADVVELIARYGKAGASRVVVRSGPDQQRIRDFARHLLPYFKRK